MKKKKRITGTDKIKSKLFVYDETARDQLRAYSVALKSKDSPEKFRPDLTPKQMLFIQEFIAHKNATQAYMRAFNMSNRSVAGCLGFSMLRKPNVRSVIEQGLAQENRKVALSKNKVLARLEEFALHGPRDKIATLCLDMLNKYFRAYTEGSHVDEPEDEKDKDKDAYVFIKVKS